MVQCNDCHQQYSVTVGTVFENSKIPLNKWLLANHLLCASKKGISAHQLHGMLGITYKSAWFILNRIREAMRPLDVAPMGGNGGTVEVDETFISREPKVEARKGGFQHKMKAPSLLDLTTGEKRSIVLDKIPIAEITPILRENIAAEAHLMTDDAGQYRFMRHHFASHCTIPHMKGANVDPDNSAIHTNTTKGSFSIFKRRMRGVYQHCGKQHLHRYVAEFDFRYTNRRANGIEDDQRADIALRVIAGKRVTYRRANGLYT